MMMNKIKVTRHFLLVAIATGIMGGASAFADIKIHFSKAQDPNITQVAIDFNFEGLAPGAVVGIDFTNPSLTAVTAAHNDNAPRSFTIKGESKDHSKKVVYLQTSGAKTGVQIFRDFESIRNSEGLNSHFSWFVGDGYFAVDESMLADKVVKGTFYIKKPVTEIIEADVLGKTLQNGKVTISSSN